MISRSGKVSSDILDICVVLNSFDAIIKLYTVGLEFKWGGVKTVPNV